MVLLVQDALHDWLIGQQSILQRPGKMKRIIHILFAVYLFVGLPAQARLQVPAHAVGSPATQVEAFSCDTVTMSLSRSVRRWLRCTKAPVAQPGLDPIAGSLAIETAAGTVLTVLEILLVACLWLATS